jgi:hypothetical protein
MHKISGIMSLPILKQSKNLHYIPTFIAPVYTNFFQHDKKPLVSHKLIFKGLIPPKILLIGTPSYNRE